MSAPRRWIRLDTGCFDSEWLAGLSPTAQHCWIRLLLYVKSSGVRGAVKRLGPIAIERIWGIPKDAFEAMESAAVADGAIVVDGDNWVLTNWAKYQDPDSTNRLRQQAFREKKRTGKKWSDGLSCVVCGSKKDLTRDHIIPHSHGGTDDPSNVRVLCRTCNSSRQNNLEWDADVTRYGRYSTTNTVTPAVTRHATETVTLTLEPTSTSKPAVRGKSWRIVPADWEPSQKHRDLASELRVNLDAQLTAFREWEFKEPKSNADLAFFRWLRKAGEDSRKNGNGSHPQKFHRLMPDAL